MENSILFLTQRLSFYFLPTPYLANNRKCRSFSDEPTTSLILCCLFFVFYVVFLFILVSYIFKTCLEVEISAVQLDFRTVCQSVFLVLCFLSCFLVLYEGWKQPCVNLPLIYALRKHIFHVVFQIRNLFSHFKTIEFDFSARMHKRTFVLALILLPLMA